MILTIETLTEVVADKVLPCTRCNGSGCLPEYRRIQGGVCFKCEGSGLSNRTKKVKTEKIETATVNAEIMQESETFENMLARRQAKQERFEARATALQAGEIDVFEFMWSD